MIHRVEDFSLFRGQQLTRFVSQRAFLESRNDFGQGIAVGYSKQIEEPLKTEMKRNRGNLDMIRVAWPRNCDVTITSHRLDGCALFLDTICAIHAKMNLSIHRHRFRKDGCPIDTPIGEYGVRIACD